MRQRQQTRQDATYRSRKSVQTTGAGSTIITLLNEDRNVDTPARTDYRISFRVPTNSMLQSVERAFEEIVLRGDLTVNTISIFLDDPQCQGQSRDYADGIAQYIMAILIKEQPEKHRITSRFSRYRDLFGTSLQRLSSIGRVYPRLLCAIIRFSLNDFTTTTTETGFGNLI